MKVFDRKKIKIIIGVSIIAVIGLCMVLNHDEKIVATNGSVLSTQKIEWGIKRASNHEQPDLGSTNKRIIDELNRNSNGK